MTHKEWMDNREALTNEAWIPWAKMAPLVRELMESVTKESVQFMTTDGMWIDSSFDWPMKGSSYISMIFRINPAWSGPAPVKAEPQPVEVGKLTINTYGGEDEDSGCDEYGITIDAASGRTRITMKPQDAVQLVCMLTSHLMTNGHRFKIGHDSAGSAKMEVVK